MAKNFLETFNGNPLPDSDLNNEEHLQLIFARDPGSRNHADHHRKSRQCENRSSDYSITYFTLHNITHFTLHNYMIQSCRLYITHLNT